MAFLGAIGGIVSGVVGMASSNAAAKREEQIAKWNADRLREEAAWAQSKGAVDAFKKEKEISAKASTARAVMAQSGLSTTEGTPLLLQQQFEVEKVWNSRIEMANATKTQNDLMNKAAITQYEGKLQADAMRTQGMASLLSGFAGAAKGLGSAFG